MKLVTSEEMRRIEGRIAADGLALPVLMGLAGRAVAERGVALRSFHLAPDRPAPGEGGARLLGACVGGGRLRPSEGAMRAALGGAARAGAARPELGVIALDLPSG